MLMVSAESSDKGMAKPAFPVVRDDDVRSFASLVQTETCTLTGRNILALLNSTCDQGGFASADGIVRKREVLDGVSVGDVEGARWQSLS